MRTFNKMIKETENVAYNYGCLMYEYKIANWNDVLSIIDPKDVYDNDKHEFGLEKFPHCTLLYGFHENETSLDKIYDIVNGTKPIGLNMKGVSIFDNKDYDVLKFDIDSKPLFYLNELFRNNFKYTNDYPDYHPHMTICYLKKGTFEKYLDKFNDIKLKIRDPRFKYSRSNGSKIYFDVIK